MDKTMFFRILNSEMELATGCTEPGAVALTGKNDSGMLSSLVGCNCLVDLPAGSGPVEDGQRVQLFLL